MIMSISNPGGSSMSSSSARSPESEQPRVAVAEAPVGGQLLQQRLALVEDLWQTVLRSECPAEQAERLLRMKQLSDPVLPDGNAVSTDAVVSLIRDMDLSEAIAAARAFSLYFQLVNILEQRIEEDTAGRGKIIKVLTTNIFAEESQDSQPTTTIKLERAIGQGHIIAVFIDKQLTTAERGAGMRDEHQPWGKVKVHPQMRENASRLQSKRAVARES